MDTELLQTVQNQLQEEVQSIAADINHLQEAYQARLEELEECNKSVEVAQTIQKFLSQNKAIFMSLQKDDGHSYSEGDPH